MPPSAKSDEPLAREIARTHPTGPVYQMADCKASRLFTINFYLHDRLLPVSAAPSDVPRGTLMLIPAGVDTTGLHAAGWSTPELLTERSCDFRKPAMQAVKL